MTTVPSHFTQPPRIQAMFEACGSDVLKSKAAQEALLTHKKEVEVAVFAEYPDAPSAPATCKISFHQSVAEAVQGFCELHMISARGCEDVRIYLTNERGGDF